MRTPFDLGAVLLPIALKHGAAPGDIAPGIVDLSEVALCIPSNDWVMRGEIRIVLRSGYETRYQVSFVSMEDLSLSNGSGERRRAEATATNALAAEIIFAIRGGSADGAYGS